jgi:hypothetical protein
MLSLMARAAWIVPAFFLFLAVHQSKVALDLNATATEGTPATAEVLEVHEENRVDVTYDYISLRITMPSGETMVREKMSLPHSLIPALKDKETLQVRVAPENNRDVVITETILADPVVGTQKRIAMMNGAIGFGAALFFGIGVFYWNRSLDEHGDPALRGVTEPDPDHPAGKVMR